MAIRKVRSRDITPTFKGNGTRASRLLVTNSTMGVTAYSLGLNITQPGQEAPAHVHETECETMYVTQGKVLFKIGDEETICEEDDVIHVPPGVPHGFKNVGEVESKFIWIYQPPLPEHR